MANLFTLTPGVDSFTGLAGGDNVFDFTSADLQATDTITGGATDSFVDVLRLTAAGTVAASQFSHVTNIEELLLPGGGNVVTLSDGLVAGTSIGYFAVVDGTGNDTVDASAISNNVAVAFFSNGGTDTFKGGTGNDAFVVAIGDLPSATIVGGAGIDNLILSTAGTAGASAFATVSGVEGLVLANGTNTITIDDALVAGSGNGAFAVAGAAGNDSVDASGVSNGIPIAFFSNGGSDTFKGGNGNDGFVVATADLASTTIVGGTGVDNLYLSTSGSVAAGAFGNVSGVEGLVLADGTNTIALSNALVAGSDNGAFAVAGGTGDDLVDGSGVTNAVPLAFFSNGGNDAFKGGNGNNAFVFAAAGLTAADTVQGGSAVDNLYLTTAGTVAGAAFTNVTGIEGLVLANGTNTITLTNGLMAGTSIGYFAVAGGTGNDSVDASGVNNSTAIAFYGATGGNDTFKGGNGNDAFLFAGGTLTAADTVVGGAGNDTLWMTTAGTVNTADLAGVTGIEGVLQQSGGTVKFANGITSAAALAAVGSSAVDTFDGSAVTGYALTITGNGGADVLSGGSQNDKFMIADSAFAAIDGNGGTDFVVLTQAGQTLNVTGTTAMAAPTLSC